MSGPAPRAALGLDTVDGAATEAVGAALALAAPAGLGRALRVHLQGDLGAGKTTLVRGFLRALGVAGPVRSPTYGLLEPYEVDGRTVLHLDLYRLADPSEVAALGLRDHDEPGSIWLIEWPERGAAALAAPDLRVTLVAAPDAHHVALAACTPQGEAWLRASGVAGEPGAAHDAARGTAPPAGAT
jgi:tRNA threonylcarbamoyladenosine biosynthesis protein TsaE